MRSTIDYRLQKSLKADFLVGYAGGLSAKKKLLALEGIYLDKQLTLFN